MKKFFALTLALVLFGFSPSFAQDPATQQPSAEDLEKQQAEREKNAYRLLDQVIDEAQSLRLTENRVRVQINAADMLWAQDQDRSRSLFSMAADGVAELAQTQTNTVNSRIRNFVEAGNNFVPPVNMRSFSLRQELVLTAARHDAALAYQLLAATKPPASVLNTADQRGPRAQITSEDNLEQMLLGRIAALDPKLAAQNAEQMLDKGQFPRSVPEVINQLHHQDSEAAEKLTDKTLRRLQSANILTNNEAAALAQALLTPGPRLPASVANANPGLQSQRAPVLEQSAYIDLLSAVIDSALKATPATQGNQRNVQRRAQIVPGANRATVVSQAPTDAQIEQNSARRLLAVLQASLPLIDQHLPSKAQQVRQKMTEMGMINNPTQSLAQAFSSIQGNATADALVRAAASAPPGVQSRLYQQAAYRAIDEGDTELARQIANDHLQNNARDSVMRRIDFREISKKVEGTRLDEIRQTVSRLQSDNEKITLLVQLAGDMEKTNPKLALQVLEDARQIINRRANNYEHFDQQLRVARAYATLDPARSFEILDPGISQLNELLSAAAVLSGFEVNMFRDGEMAIQGGSGLTSTINRYGQELALLARNDFERSETLAGRFQFPEARVLARLAIVQGLLEVRPSIGARIRN